MNRDARCRDGRRVETWIIVAYAGISLGWAILTFHALKIHDYVQATAAAVIWLFFAVVAAYGISHNYFLNRKKPQ